MGKPIAYFEVISPDVPRAEKFYTGLFGWSARHDEAVADYSFLSTGSETGLGDGGIGPVTEADAPGVKVYAMVEDLDEALASVNDLGGTTVNEPRDLPGGYGRFAVFADPDGNKFGLWKPPASA